MRRGNTHAQKAETKIFKESYKRGCGTMMKNTGIYLNDDEKKLLREILQSELLAIKRAAVVMSGLSKAELKRRETIINGLFRLTK